MRLLPFIILFVLSFAALSQTGKMILKSAGFAEGAPIPRIYTCDGEDLSPELEWSGAPEGTKSFAIICDDPDAPAGTWVHWVIYNIPKDQDSLARGILRPAKLEKGILQGLNSWPKTGYNGPCPPPGKAHRYFFKLYALDCVLDLKENATKDDLQKAMKDHILGAAGLMGTYKR